MYISSVKVENYKGFVDTAEAHFGPGFNMIVGTNNAGKTALIEALSLRFQNKPHRKIFGRNSSVTIGVKVDVKEFIDIALEKMSEGGNFPSIYFPLATSSGSNPDNQRALLELSLSDPLSQFEFKYTYKPDEFTAVEVVGYGKYDKSHGDMPVVKIDIDGNKVSRVSAVTSVEPRNAIPLQLGEYFKDKIYTFDAERMKISESAIGMKSELKSDASNLAEALANLQGNGNLHGKFNTLINRVFPEINHIGVYMRDSSPLGGRYRIYVWDDIAYSQGSEQLAIPLSESGTGIGQVLAILYIALTSVEPKTIIIDEPQSFLHPGAIRKLFEILKGKEFAHHQYIITTHSPLIISATNPESIIRVRKIADESIIESFDSSNRHKLNEFLGEVGAKLSDVFGADNILWVEGPTEEICFPLILSSLKKYALQGTAIIGVRNTGDFASKVADKVYALHSKLSESPSLLPQAIGFLFDRETLNKEDDETRSMFFLHRRMYENYLLTLRKTLIPRPLLPQGEGEQKQQVY